MSQCLIKSNSLAFKRPFLPFSHQFLSPRCQAATFLHTNSDRQQHPNSPISTSIIQVKGTCLHREKEQVLNPGSFGWILTEPPKYLQLLVAPLKPITKDTVFFLYPKNLKLRKRIKSPVKTHASPGGICSNPNRAQQLQFDCAEANDQSKQFSAS